MTREVMVAVSVCTLAGAFKLAQNAQALEKGITEQYKAHSSSSGCCAEYKGKKVYFCCPECKAKFEAEPEKYVAKLPQFAKQRRD